MEFSDKIEKQASLQVIGFCEICKQRIECAALSVAGVHSAIWNIADNNLVLCFDPQLTSMEEISKAISEEGYETQMHKAEKKDGHVSPECCRYD